MRLMEVEQQSESECGSFTNTMIRRFQGRIVVYHNDDDDDDVCSV